jgi:glycerol uptake facilitator-like aquaporin
MEIKGGHNIKFHASFQEFLGTAYLIFAINMSAGSPLQAVVIGITLLTQICFTGPTCGAHFNPAVTIACYVIEW